MEEKENRVKIRRSIPILTKKHFYSMKPYPQSSKSAQNATKNSEIDEKKDARKDVGLDLPSLASSQASFAAGLRGKSTQPVVSGKRGGLTPGRPGWRARLWKTPKSILKRRAANNDVALLAKTTGHKQKGLKDATNIEGNRPRRHVSLKLDFKDGTKSEAQSTTDMTESQRTDDIDNITLKVKEVDNITLKVKEVDKDDVSLAVDNANGVNIGEMADAGGDETEKDKGHNDSLSDIQCLSLDNIITDNQENLIPATLTPDAGVAIADDANHKKDFEAHTQKDSVRKLLKSQSVHREKGHSKVDKPVPEKTKKSLTRSATFSGAASKRNIKPASESSKPHYGGNNRGIRRYSDLKRSEEELIQKNALLEAKLMESSMRIHNLETSLSESRGRFDEVEHEHFELREELEAKEKYFSETLERKQQFYMKENERLQERLDQCVEKLIQLKIDPVTLESMEQTQSQAKKEEFIRARLEAKVQCKIFQQKLDSFIRCSEERFNDLMSKDFEDIHEANKETGGDAACYHDPPEMVRLEDSVQDRHVTDSDPSKGDSVTNGNADLNGVPQTKQCEARIEFRNVSLGCPGDSFEGSWEHIHAEGLPESSP